MGESRKRVASGYGRQRGCDEERSVEDDNHCARPCSRRLGSIVDRTE